MHVVYAAVCLITVPSPASAMVKAPRVPRSVPDVQGCTYFCKKVSKLRKQGPVDFPKSPKESPEPVFNEVEVGRQLVLSSLVAPGQPTPQLQGV